MKSILRTLALAAAVVCSAGYAQAACSVGAAPSGTPSTLGTMANQPTDQVVIKGGCIDRTPIGANTASSVAATTLNTSGTATMTGTNNLTGPTYISGAPPVACGATCTLGAANKGTYTQLDTAAGSVATLPGATGSGDTYKMYVSVITTSAADKVLTNPITDTIIGTAIGETSGTAKVFVGNASTYHSIQMPFGGSQPSGGFVGDTIVCTDVASTIWKCDINYQAGTTPTTPYSASTT